MDWFIGTEQHHSLHFYISKFTENCLCVEWEIPFRLINSRVFCHIVLLLTNEKVSYSYLFVNMWCVLLYAYAMLLDMIQMLFDELYSIFCGKEKFWWLEKCHCRSTSTTRIFYCIKLFWSRFHAISLLARVQWTTLPFKYSILNLPIKNIVRDKKKKKENHRFSDPQFHWVQFVLNSSWDEHQNSAVHLFRNESTDFNQSNGND